MAEKRYTGHRTRAGVAFKKEGVGACYNNGGLWSVFNIGPEATWIIIICGESGHSGVSQGLQKSTVEFSH